MQARFVHIGLTAQDWRRLSAFYCQVFGCAPIYPIRDLAGQWLERAVGVPAARVQGIHLRLPGYGPGGPTLEIFQYDDEVPERVPFAANRPGQGHLAFTVEDVEAALRQVLVAGGGVIGEVTTTIIPGVGAVTFVYATDPEGNVIELQHWAPRGAP